MLKGIQNFLELVNENWTTIAVIIGLLIMLGKKVFDFIGKSDEEKVEIAKAQIQQAMLKMITSAELDFEQWNQAGSIKRSQVIEEIFLKYPVLSKVTNQEEIIAWIDTEINNSLKTLRKVVEDNKTEGE